MATENKLASFIAMKKALGLPVSKQEITALSQQSLATRAQAEAEVEIRNQDFAFRERALDANIEQANFRNNLLTEQIAQKGRADTIRGVGQLGFLSLAGARGKDTGFLDYMAKLKAIGLGG